MLKFPSKVAKAFCQALSRPPPHPLDPLFMTTLFILKDFIVFICIGSSASLYVFFSLFCNIANDEIIILSGIIY